MNDPPPNEGKQEVVETLPSIEQIDIMDLEEEQEQDLELEVQDEEDEEDDNEAGDEEEEEEIELEDHGEARKEQEEDKSVVTTTTTSEGNNNNNKALQEEATQGIFLKNMSNKEDAPIFQFFWHLIDRRPLVFKIKGPKSSTTATGKKLKNIEEVIGVRKSVLYENCQMLDPEGILLCTINKKKVKWYLDRNIATLVSQDPLTIQLKFKPGGNGHAGNPYYTSAKENKCVVCGNTEKYVRHSIVPHSYRQYLSEQVKSRSSHDIVLLCALCLAKTHPVDLAMRKKMSVEYGVSLDGNGPKYIVDENLAKKKSLATAYSQRSKIPPSRVASIEAELRKALNFQDSQALDDQLIQDLSTSNPKILNPNYLSHEEMLVAKLSTLKDVELFVQKWRKNFIDHLKPQHLPPYWSVTAPIVHQ